MKYLVITLIIQLTVSGCTAQVRHPEPAAVLSMKIAVGKEPGSVEIADLNRDGNPDLAVANVGSGNVTILLGSEKGEFTEAKGSPFPAGNQPNDIAIGDFNRDAKLDLAFANHEEKHLTVLFGDGNGGYTPAPGSPIAVDVRPHTHGVATADLNGDGNPDLFTDDWANDQVVALFGDGKGNFRTPGTFLKVGKRPYQRHRIADVNNDGKADIITTNIEGNNITVLLGDGKGGFKQSAGSPFSSGDCPFNLAVGDVNGDGKADLAVVNSPGSMAEGHGKDGLTVLIGDGTGAFKIMPGSPFATGRIPNRAAIGDINGDGINDIAVSSPDDNNITLFLMDRGNVASQVSLAVGGKPKGLGIGDLNGDGKADIVVTNGGVDSISILFGK